MYIFVDKNTEICPLRDSQLRVTLTNVCMWAFDHTPCSAVSHHISHRFEVIADYFQFGTKNGHFAFLSPSEELRATYAVHIRLIENPIVNFLRDIIKVFREVLRRYGKNQLKFRIFEGVGRNFRQKGTFDTNHFCTFKQAIVAPYNLAAESFHINFVVFIKWKIRSCTCI